MRQSIDNLATGISPDLPDWNLPDGAWSDSRNVRYRDGAVEKMRGHEEIWGDLSATAIWAAPISDGSNYFWVYGSTTALYATDGTTHANVSSATYTAGLDLAWSGGAYNGYMVANCGTSPPQTWVPSLANKFTELANWPATTLCQVLRPFRNYLVALRVSESGSYNPRLLRWSSSALPGGLPNTWDYTDPSYDAGRVELAQTGDLLVDCLALRDFNIIYKEQHTWLMEFIGGFDVFGFRQLFSNVGMLTENCGAAFSTNHLVLTDNDIVVHDGNQVQSVANNRLRSWLFSRINTSRYKRSFVVANHRAREIWICIPEAGYDYPNLAVIWNWQDDKWYVRDLSQPLSYAATGVVSGTAVTFDADTPGTFDGGVGSFDEESYSAFEQRLVMLNASSPTAYQADSGELYGGVTPTCYALRRSINLGRDIFRTSRLMRIFPKVLGTPGDTLRIRIGVRDAIDASVAWQGPYIYTIGVDHKVDVRVNGRVVDIQFEYIGTNTFRLFSFDLEYEPQGYR